MAALLERFYEPTEGAIFLDGRDICTLDPTWLRGEIIGFINQVRNVGGVEVLVAEEWSGVGKSPAED